MRTTQNNLPRSSPTRSELALLGWRALVFAVAAVDGFFRPGDWFSAWSKPGWNPPGWIFGPVWSALCTIMAIAAWPVWRCGGFFWGGQRVALSLFLLQLGFDALWSPRFFGLHQPALAFKVARRFKKPIEEIDGAFGSNQTLPNHETNHHRRSPCLQLVCRGATARLSGRDQ